MRIAIARVAQETNSLSPVVSELGDFERTHLVSGPELLARCASRFRTEAPGFLRNAELSGAAQEARRLGAEVVPLFSAWAVPGGPMSSATLAHFQERLARGLRAARAEGLVLSLHGALSHEGGGDGDVELLRAAREAAPGVRVAATLDLHAHLNAAKVDLADLLVGYRTNPHRDHAACGARAASLLVRQLRGEIRPTVAWRSLPMVLGGGTTIDVLPPMRSLYRKLAEVERRPGVLGAWGYQCQLWNALPDAGWASYVLTDDDPDLAEEVAEEIADALWATRHALPPELPDASAAIARARAATWRRRLGVVCISDASDMVGAGAVGEATALLGALIAEGEGLVSYAPVRDAEAVGSLWEVPSGERVTVDVGGRLAPRWHRPLRVTGRVAGRRDTAFGRAVLLDLGHVKLVITERAPLAMKPAFYRDMGLRLRDADVVVVKSLFPFRLYFLPYNRLTLYAKTGGTTDFDAWRHIAYDRPVHPKDAVAEWRPLARGQRPEATHAAQSDAGAPRSQAASWARRSASAGVPPVASSP